LTSLILWGLKHSRLFIKIYTIVCLFWLIILITAFTSYILAKLSIENVLASIFAILILGLPPLLVLAFLKRREEKLRRRMPKVDPYILSAVEKIKAMEKYFKGVTSVSWSPVISMAHDALLALLQKMIIDSKGSEGIALIEQLRREKKINLSTLVKILRQFNVIDEDEEKNIEILRDLRNRVVHEDYHPSKEQALWALNLVKTITRKHYPDITL